MGELLSGCLGITDGDLLSQAQICDTNQQILEAGQIRPALGLAANDGDGNGRLDSAAGEAGRTVGRCLGGGTFGRGHFITAGRRRRWRHAGKVVDLTEE